MLEMKEMDPLVFLRYSGTENGVMNQDSTACSDSLASMMANTVIVLGPFATDFEEKVVPAEDPSEYKNE